MKINKEFKKKTIITAGVLAVSALAVIGGSTFAKYFTKIEGSGNAEIAKWSFRANNTSTVMEKIQLSNVYNTNILKNKTIAPGTNGSFDIILDATGADVAIDYAVTFDNLVNKPTNMKFTYEGTTADSLKGLEQVLKGRIRLDDARTKKLTIEWAWDYQTGTTVAEKEKNDQIDTNDSGKEFTFDITVTGTQVNPQG